MASAPGLVYVARTRAWAGNTDACWRLVQHDRALGRQSRWAWTTLGGGGGRRDPELRFAPDGRSFWSATRPLAGALMEDDWSASLTVEESVADEQRLGLGRRGLSQERLVALRQGRAEHDEPAWDLDALAASPGGIAGFLRARRALARVALVGPPGTAWFGSLRAGERIDLSRARWTAPSGPRHEESGSEPIDRLAWAALAAVDRSRPSSVYSILGQAHEACDVQADGRTPGTPWTVHAEVVSRDDKEAPLASVLPAERRERELRVLVPEALWASLHERGLSLEPMVDFLDRRSRPVVSGTAAAGFREAVFRVNAALPPRVPAAAPTVVCSWGRDGGRR
jgi:hypothetical protein